MSSRVKSIIKAVVFLAVGAIILVVCAFIVQPTWGSANYNPTYGFYDEPTDTIETIFLGGSHVYRGISPTQLYEDYGICAYDLSTDAQSVMASYYWLEEAYHFHSDTLDTVVLDASMLRSEETESANHKAIDPMRFSFIKIKAVRAYSEGLQDFLNNMSSILSYHDRWKELSESDFLKIEKTPELCLRGFYYSTRQVVDEVDDVSELHLPLLVLDENESPAELNDMEVFYFEKIATFCEDHDIQLILIKTPTDWTSADHNAVQALANTYGLDFIDFNIEPYYSEIGYDFAADSYDAGAKNSNIHANYYGAVKITDYIGHYLIEVCGNRDVRNDENYEYMREELDEYDRYISLRQSISQATDPCDYIEDALEYGDNTIFISVKGDAATSMTEKQRAYFDSIGLTALSELVNGESYLAVINHGDIIVELGQKIIEEDKSNEAGEPVSYEGSLLHRIPYNVISGGYDMGDLSSIIIEGTEQSENQRGLNIVIYDNSRQECVDSANFDTCDAPERLAQFNGQNWEILLEEGVSPSELVGTDRILYQYYEKCEDIRAAAQPGKQADSDDS